MFKKILVGLMVFILSGCTSTDPYTGEKKVSNTGISTFIGAASGALVGAVASGGKAKGALIGAAGGAAVGAATGVYLDKQESELRTQLRNSGVQVYRTKDKKSLQLIMPGDITFKQNSADINSDFYSVLRSISIVLKKYDKTLVNINGHASSEGNDNYNLKLSERRAQSIAAFFRSQGIKKQRLIARGFGSTRPIADNSSATGRKKNRRVTISLTEL